MGVDSTQLSVQCTLFKPIKHFKKFINQLKLLDNRFNLKIKSRQQYLHALWCFPALTCSQKLFTSNG